MSCGNQCHHGQLRVVSQGELLNSQNTSGSQNHADSVNLRSGHEAVSEQSSLS